MSCNKQNIYIHSGSRTILKKPIPDLKNTISML
jgi:hypothetical protein